MVKKQNNNAGNFGRWLSTTRQALHHGRATEVPCGSCTACCTSSYFIHIRPDEKKTLSRIPKELLFPAPDMLKGHQVLGFDRKGHCPMFKNNACSIYEDRPMTCRQYDCRVFTATGLPAGDEKKKLINQQVEHWRFGFSSVADDKLYQIVRKTARFLVKNRKKFPKDFIPAHTTQLAILAIKVYPVLVKHKNCNNEELLIKDIVKSVLNP